MIRLTIFRAKTLVHCEKKKVLQTKLWKRCIARKAAVGFQCDSCSCTYYNSCCPPTHHKEGDILKALTVVSFSLCTMCVHRVLQRTGHLCSNVGTIHWTAVMMQTRAAPFRDYRVSINAPVCSRWLRVRLPPVRARCRCPDLDMSYLI